jgi:TonB family protein
VSFKVSKDGTASNLQLSQASASAECNQANLQAIKDSSPFEHLPEGAPDSVDVQFHFDQDIVPGR